MKIWPLLGAIWICSASYQVAAATTFQWAAMALSVKDNKPIEGVEFYFAFTDTRNGRRTEKTCTTPADGICTLQQDASGGGFFGRASNMNAEVRYKKDGFLEMANIVWKDTSSGKTAFFLLTPVGYPEEQAALARARDEEKRRAEVTAARKRYDLIANLADAHAGASLPCLTKSHCEKMFALTELYITEYSGTKIQTATPTTITTYNPIEPNEVSLNGRRLPGKADGSTISIKAVCKDVLLNPSDRCLESAVIALNGFAPYMKKFLRN
jgi:hypothetical protein